jgi:hypothetical protein
VNSADRDLTAPALTRNVAGAVFIRKSSSEYYGADNMKKCNSFLEIFCTKQKKLLIRQEMVAKRITMSYNEKQ